MLCWAVPSRLTTILSKRQSRWLWQRLSSLTCPAGIRLVTLLKTSFEVYLSRILHKGPLWRKLCSIHGSNLLKSNLSDFDHSMKKQKQRLTKQASKIYLLITLYQCLHSMFIYIKCVSYKIYSSLSDLYIIQIYIVY